MALVTDKLAAPSDCQALPYSYVWYQFCYPRALPSPPSLSLKSVTSLKNEAPEYVTRIHTTFTSMFIELR